MKITGRWAIIGALAAMTGGGARANAQADRASASFSCAVAHTPVARTICADPDLASADREMARLFAQVRVSAFGSGPSNQLAAQRSALRTMRDCLEPTHKQRAADCIGAVYARRNSELAIAALVTTPEPALAVLRRIDPPAAPLIEAVAIWAGEPVDADWSSPGRAETKARLATLLLPYMTDLQSQADQSFGRSILSDPGTDGVTVKTIEDVFLSDRHFAAFLNVLGPYLPDAGSGGQSLTGRRTLPCAAIVRHPALLHASGSVFGSTMDNFVLDNDCEQALPPTPALAALNAKLMRSWPQCDGTIRFAAYRTYQSALDEARLGQTTHDKGAALEERPGITRTDVAAVRTELMSYYTTYLRQAPTTAAAMAHDALVAILASAHECGG